MVVCNLFKQCLEDSFFGVSVVMVFRRAVSLHNDFQKKHFKTIFKHNQPLFTCLIFHPETSASKKKHYRKKRWRNWMEKVMYSSRFRARGIHFSIEFKFYLSDIQNHGTLWKKSQKNLIPESTTVFITRFSFALFCLICCFLDPTLLNCWSDELLKMKSVDKCHESKLIRRWSGHTVLVKNQNKV